jgi:type VI secretion system secreted protein VgrG
MGSIPHGKNIDSHHIQQNHVKAITTRSGSQVLFNDTKHHIKISTSAGNIIKIHEKTGAISITSASSISLNSEVINIHASQLVDIQAPKITVGSIAAPAPASGDENAKQPAATETIEMKAKVIDIKADQKLTGTAPNTTLEGKKKNLIKSDTLVDIAGGAGANVHATLVKIN